MKARHLKRAIDVFGSLFALALLWPVMIIVAIWVAPPHRAPSKIRSRVTKAGRKARSQHGMLTCRLFSMAYRNNHSCHHQVL